MALKHNIKWLTLNKTNSEPAKWVISAQKHYRIIKNAALPDYFTVNKHWIIIATNQCILMSFQWINFQQQLKHQKQLPKFSLFFLCTLWSVIHSLTLESPWNKPLLWCNLMLFYCCCLLSIEIQYILTSWLCLLRNTVQYLHSAVIGYIFKFSL